MSRYCLLVVLVVDCKLVDITMKDTGMSIVTMSIYKHSELKTVLDIVHLHLSPNVSLQWSVSHCPQMSGYMPNQAPTSTQSFRYTYPTMPYMQSMAEPPGPSGEVPKAVAPPGEQQQNESQYGGVPQYGCTMMPFPHMTVQAVETYQPPMYPQQPQQQQPPGGQAQNYAARVDAPQFSQAQPVPVYYNATPTSNAAAPPQGAAQVITYPSVGQLTSHGSTVYRAPRTPPPPRGCAIGGQPGSVAPAPQYNMLSYSTYPPQAQSQPPRNLVPSPGYGTVATPVGQPLQAYPVLRPIGGVAMSLPNRTTPPPAQPYHPAVSMVTGSPQLKLVAVEQRPPKSAELYNPELNKQMTLCPQAAQPAPVVPLVRVPLNGAQYRVANSMAPSEYSLFVIV